MGIQAPNSQHSNRHSTSESKKITMGRPQKNKRVKDSESSSDSEVEERTPPPKKGKVAKKQVSSDSDSGPDDCNPPPKKGNATGPKRTDDGEPSWELDRQRILKVRTFKGKVLIDIREYYEKDGKQLPGKKGISLSAAQWQKLKQAIPEVDEAIKEA